MRPKRLLFHLCSGILGLGLVGAFVPEAVLVWQFYVLALLVVGVVDLLLCWRQKMPEVERTVETALPLGVWRTVKLTLRNPTTSKMKVRACDFHPQGLDIKGLPFSGQIPASSELVQEYGIRSTSRGLKLFQGCQILLTSPLGLWERSGIVGEANEVRVYPNFQKVAKLTMMDSNQRLAQVGIHKRRRRGSGRDFHQLREFVQGDPLRQIDWKASARMRKVISKEYRDERDQQVVFLLDCGQSMRAKDGDLSHFDHALNSVLLMTSIALRGGDAVGLMTFGSTERRLAARKGASQMNLLLNRVYDIEPGLQTADYMEMARQVMGHCRKRTLLVLVTNVRDEGDTELAPALRLLRRKHLVLLAGMREKVLHDVQDRPIVDFDDALELSGVHAYLHRRREVFDGLKQNGIMCLDVIPQELPMHMVNTYLDIKRQGLL